MDGWMFQFMCVRKESLPLNDSRLTLLYWERRKAEVVGKGIQARVKTYKQRRTNFFQDMKRKLDTENINGHSEQLADNDKTCTIKMKNEWLGQPDPHRQASLTQSQRSGIKSMYVIGSGIKTCTATAYTHNTLEYRGRIMRIHTLCVLHIRSIFRGRLNKCYWNCLFWEVSVIHYIVRILKSTET